MKTPILLAGKTPLRNRLGIVLWLVSLALLPVARAQFTFATNNGSLTIIAYTGPGGDVVIPSTANGYPVTCIGVNAFYDCTALTSVLIGNRVLGIEEGAFYRCSGLTNVVIADSVTNIGDIAFCDCTALTSLEVGNRVISIGNFAFSRCPSLASVTIPASVTSIVYSAFINCSGLTNIVVLAGNPAYASAGCVLFNRAMTTLVECSQGLRGGYSIPDSVTSIGYGAFYACSGLTNVVIPNSVTNLGDDLFWDCSSLVSEVIPNHVTSIPDYAFCGCAGLTSVTISESVTNIESYAFFGCSGLTNLTIPDSVIGLGPNAFSSCSNLVNLVIGNGLTSIGNCAFCWCSSLVNVTIPDRVTHLGDGAFDYCYHLATVCFWGNAPGIDGFVFVNDTNTVCYYSPGTTGWSATFGGCPTAVWLQAPSLLVPPSTQTAEAGANVLLSATSANPLPLSYFWYFDDTNLLAVGTNSQLVLPNLQLSQSGAYTVVISNLFGVMTSPPAMLAVITPTAHRLVPGLNVGGQTGSVVNVDYTDALSPAANWLPLGSISLASPSQYCFDVSAPLPPARFYRASTAGISSQLPTLDLHLVPAVKVIGDIGSSWRVDYINQFGPTNAWIALATVTLTNTSQLYFDLSAMDQSLRLYRLVSVP